MHYEVKTGNITVLKQGQRLATDKDFRATVGSIIIDNGQSSGQLPVQIIDESDPEIAEVFIVNITQVELVTSPHNTSGMAPKLGTHRTAQVTINSNDNPRGLLGFTRIKYDDIFLSFLSDFINVLHICFSSSLPIPFLPSFLSTFLPPSLPSSLPPILYSFLFSFFPCLSVHFSCCPHFVFLSVTSNIY